MSTARSRTRLRTRSLRADPGDPGLGDWLERVTFNAAQGARAADGRALAYLCSDTRFDATAHRPDSYSLLNGKHGRYKLSPTHDDIACCCNPNSTRLLPHYVSSMWLGRTDSPGLVALAYGPSDLHTTVDGTAFNIRQETLYPFEDRVRFTIEAATPTRLTLWLRRPAWASAFHLDGIEGVERDGWIVVAREWRGRMSFTLRFDVPVRAERIRPAKSRCCAVRCSSCSRFHIARGNCRFRCERTGRMPNCSPMTGRRSRRCRSLIPRVLTWASCPSVSRRMRRTGPGTNRRYDCAATE